MTLAGLGWLATAAYAIHIGEEYVLNWREWARSLSGVEVRREFFSVLNALVIVLGIVCAELAPRFPAIALAYPALMLINATFFHLLAFVWTRGRFSPGMISAVVLFYPVGILCFREAWVTGVLTGRVLAEALLAGAALMAIPVVLLKLCSWSGFC